MTTSAKPVRHFNDQPLILMIGVGDLLSRLLNMALAKPHTQRVVLGGRDESGLQARANLARFAAHNLGVSVAVDTVRIDLCDIDATGQTLERLRPDIVLNGASLQSWRRITELPKPVFAELDEAQLGPWLPMHLAPVHQLMQAVRASGTDPIVLNAAYPDAVGPVLRGAGLAPQLGVGNVANIVPALTFGYAKAIGVDAHRVSIRLVAHHYVSHYVPRFGRMVPGVHALDVRVDGARYTGAVTEDEVFAMLTGPLKRLGGVEGQLLTASSAMGVLHAVAADDGTVAHAPAPAGRPGGYPVSLRRNSVELDLPYGLSEADAIAINEAGQRCDGIEAIDADGTVTFTEPEMAVMTRLLGYECRTMKLAECASWAEELAARYREFASRFRAS